MVDELSDSNLAEMRHVFNMFDRVKSDGNITPDEFRHFLGLLGIDPSRGELDDYFAAFDSTGNGRIDYAEFLSMITKKFVREPE